MNNPRIIFMGTPAFAVATLDALVNAGKNIVAVITAPDKPAGRGMKLTMSAVKTYALEKGIDVLQPPKLKDPEFLAELKAYAADLQVVVAFRMLPEVVWNMPPLGTINVHASLLPAYRGAAPINWAIINGEKRTGVTTFRLTHEIDTGNILLREEVPIREDETAGELHDVLMTAGARLAVKTVEGLVAGTLIEQPQPQLTDAPHAPKIFTDTCRIEWTKRARDIYNLIRGLSPFPTAFATLHGKTVKIFRAEMEITADHPQPGVVQTDAKTYLRFACADGFIYLTDLQLEGKKRLGIGEFLRGYRAP